MMHGVVLLGIFSLAAVVMLDLLILVWGYGPVNEAALRGEASTVIFLIGIYPVAESSWTGMGAIALGTLLLLAALVLFLVHRSPKVPGLSGYGTRFMVLSFAAGGMATLAWAGYLVATGHLTEGLATSRWLPTPIGLLSLKFDLLSHWHGILIGAILMSATVMVIKDLPDLWRRFQEGLSRMELPTIRTDNTWIVVFRMYLAILFFYVLYFTLLKYFTIEPSVPTFSEMPLWDQLFMFADASVWEEILSRTLMLGVPLLIYHAIQQRSDKPIWRYLVGGEFKIENAAFVLMFIQALVFALAHVSGWDLWKVLPTTISGMAFGYLFLKRGLWAAIMLHFTFDYLGMTADALMEWGLDIEIGFNALYLLWVAVGFIIFIHYMVVILKDGPGALSRALFGTRGEEPDDG